MKRADLLFLECKEKASQFRNQFGYGPDDPIHLRSFLLKQNVISLFKPLSGGFSGMAMIAGGKKFMMINHNHTLGKQHFTIAHELYHLFVQENFTSRKCVTGLFLSQSDIEEKKADLFAASLLLPEIGVTSLIPKEERTGLISDQTIFKIQQVYSVSVKSTIFRLKELGFVNDSYFDKYKSGSTEKIRNLGYDTRLMYAGNQDLILGDYAVLAKELFQSDKISESKYFTFLNAVNIDPLQRLENGEE
ncbi:ImmA/IrrE family metallo-endopeptidase [Algoriphagus sp.]|uniref:ImmA/IrrE family metallo-endopeptidase n=1 Tax=Algoriphagus sp. TaxID=1872435 RepID=UPI003F731022